MLDRLFGPHSENLQRALDRTTLRQSLLMTNLTNVNVPGYKRRDVDFSVKLQEEMRGPVSGSSRFRTNSDVDDQSYQEDTASIRTDQNSVDMEREVVSMAETDLRFKALTQITSSYFSGIKNVIREGR